MKINITIHTNQNKLDVDYRRLFIHILKETFKGTEYEDLVLREGRVAKPYTFSVGFGRIVEVSSEKLIFGGPIYFDFATPLHTMIGYIYNYFRSLKRRKIGELYIEKTEQILPMPKVIKAEKITYKTIGHMTLPRKGEEFDIEEAVKYSLLSKLSTLRKLFPQTLQMDEKLVDCIKVINEDTKLLPSKVKHYGGFVDTYRGVITIKAPSSVHNFILELGLGIRTGQGFGMVKVVKEWKS